jgi:hypothetical protein
MPPTSQGTVSLNSSTCTFTFTPAAGFAGYVQQLPVFEVSGQGGMGSESVLRRSPGARPGRPGGDHQELHRLGGGTDLTVTAANGLQVGDSGTGSLTSTR